MSQIDDLLTDLKTITEISNAGVISKLEEKLEQGETRTVAVLYLDVVGFSALIERLSSEQVTRLIDRAFRIFELTANAHGGYCDKVIGDAALYVFTGHPNYPPVCEAALRAALKLLERIDQVNASLVEIKLRVAIRIGVSFGEVTRQPVGRDMAQVTVMGETVNIAQRLETSAEPNTILTTIRVLEKAGDIFVAEVTGKQELKGIGPVNVYAVSGVEETVHRLRGAFRRLTPLIGRNDVLRGARKLITRWWRAKYSRETWDIAESGMAVPGRNRLIVFNGATAIGKSRLAFELIAGLSNEPGICSATAHCSEHASITAFASEIVRIAGIDAENLPRRWAELCAHAETAVGPDYAERQRRYLPAIAYVLGCDEVDTSGIRLADSKSFELECELAVRSSIELAAHFTGKPVVLVIEDLQWMGGLKPLIESILELACLPRPLVVIGTARPEYKHRQGGLGEGEYKEWKLSRLNRGQTRAVFKALLPGLRLPGGLLDELVDKSAGLPYYVEEFARMLVQRGLVREDNGSFKLVGSLADLAIPEGIRALVLGRLDLLEYEHRELAKRAAVLGRDFHISVLKAMEARLGCDHPGHPEDDLQSLVEHHILGSEQGGVYCFEHLLLQQAAYSALLEYNRRVLHNVAADVFAQRHVRGMAGELGILREMIRHLKIGNRQAEVHDRTCDVLMLLTQTGQYEEWRSWEELAETSWAAVRDTDRKQGPASASLLRAQAAKKWQQGAPDEAYSLYVEALAAVRAANDTANEARILGGLGILHSSQGRAKQALEYYEQALDLARECEVRVDEAKILGNIGNLHQRQGHLDAALAAYRTALGISRDVDDSRGEGMILMYLGALHSQRGLKEQSLSYYRQALALAHRGGNRIGESAVLSNMGTLYAGGGQLDQALSHFRQSLSIDREIGDRLGEGYNLFNQGDLLMEQDRLDEAKKALNSALDCFRAVNCPHGEGMGLACLGEIYLRLGFMGKAKAAFDRALALLKQEADGVRLGHLHCQHIRYFLEVGDMDGAAAALKEAENIGRALDVTAESDLARAIVEARELLQHKSAAAGEENQEGTPD